MRKNFNIKKFFNGFGELFKYLYSSKIKDSFNLDLKILPAIILLGAIGIGRNILEVMIGGDWARKWFAYTPDVYFTMFFYPIFLCFFSVTLLHFFSNKFGLKIKIIPLFSIMFFMQVVHLIIPFFDGLAHVFDIPFRIWFSDNIYKILIFSPLALTPLIILFTYPTSLGIDVVWFFVTFVLIKMYIKKFKFPMIKSLAALAISFYITYMSIYPIYYFFINEGIIGSNYMFGLFFLFMSIPSIIYVAIMKKVEAD